MKSRHAISSLIFFAVAALFALSSSAPVTRVRGLRSQDEYLTRRSELISLSRTLLEKSRGRREAAKLAAQARGWPVSGTARDGGIYELQDIHEGVPRYYKTFNADAAATTRTDSVNLEIGGGAGMIIGLWDGGGPRLTHQELTGRVMWGDDQSYGMRDHATHVAGTMIASGVRTEAKGMASEATVRSYNWNDDLAEMAAEAAEGLVVSNHSYGTVRGWEQFSHWYWFGDTAISETEDYKFGFYDYSAVEADEFASLAPYYLAVVSASNDRNDSLPAGTQHYYWDSRYGTWRWSTKARDKDGGEDGFDCLVNGFQTAKNMLVVGAVDDVYDYTGPEDIVMSVFSSWGPTDDGRIKPDIVGNGIDVYSSLSSSDTSYAWGSGTSMASPNVCGSLALLQDYYRDLHGGGPMRAATLRALAIHAAREAGPGPGPDYMFGWGLLDTYAAYKHIESDSNRTGGLMEELTLNEGYPVRLRYACDGTAGELRVTITWADPPGTPPALALDPPDLALVNDLDLRVSRSAVEYEPWTLDPGNPAAPAATGDNYRDNVEQIVIPDPDAGTYVVTIDHKGGLYGGTQDFSLIVSGAEMTDTWHVYADGSGDAPTIAAAVDSASPGDLILVYPGVYNEHDIVIVKKLVIKGAGGAENTVVDAQFEGRLMSFPAGGDTVRIEDITMRHGTVLGAAADGHGGAVYCGNSELTMINCYFRHNQARAGGAVYIDQSSPELKNCRMFENSTYGNGAGIYLYSSSASIENCIIAQNSARGDGGGLYLDESAPDISDCTVSHNLALEHGGGIFTGYGSDPVISGSIVSHGPFGEGIYGAPGAGGASIVCCDIFGNVDGDYGGSIGDRTGSEGNISLDPLFCDPDAFDYGIDNNSPCRPEGNTCGVLIGALPPFCNTGTMHTVEQDGSGDYPKIQAAVDASTPGDTVLLGPGTYTGEGNRDISFNGKSIVLTSREGRTATIIDCESVPGNNHFGILLTDGEDTTTVIEGITVTGASKGGIRCTDGSSPTIRDCVVTGNVTYDGWYGGGIYFYGAATKISGCEISGNHADGNGGGIECKNSELLIENCVVSDNVAEKYGGGIGAANGSVVTVKNCIVSGNSAVEDGGGGTYTVFSTMTVEDCVVSGNSATDGGGIFNGISGLMAVTGTLIYGNAAGNGAGGVYSSANLTMENCTVVENSATYYGAGVECVYGNQNSISRTIIADNDLSEGIFTIMNTMDISCSDVFGNTGGNYGGSTPDQTGMNSNFSVDPVFCTPDTNDYSLFYSSPCIAANSPCGELIGALGIGCAEQTGIDDVDGDHVPAVTRLQSIYPNPFNPITRICFDLSARTAVHIAVYDVAGRRVKVLADRVIPPGSHSVVWDGSTGGGQFAASGIYFCRFIAGDVVETKKMILLR